MLQINIHKNDVCKNEQKYQHIIHMYTLHIFTFFALELHKP